ncbi:MAG TPA: hypothetical protein VIC59_11265 [Gemmatimonadota bacterium]|jgi:hypothetical protein
MAARQPLAALRRARLLWPITALTAAFLPAALSCGDDETAPVGPGPVTRLEILVDEEPATELNVVAGTHAEVEVGGLDSQGRDNEDAEFTASSSDEAVATVAGGQHEASRVRLAHTGFEVEGVAPGTATITFREENSGTTADLEVTVTAAP